MRELIFVPKISLTPDSVSLYNDVFYRSDTDDQLKSIRQGGNHINAERLFHNFEISEAAQRNIKKKINWLFVLSKSHYVKTYGGKEIFNFKINFLTLTLPSKQLHPTSEITSVCFNHFLTEMRERTKMTNYVWRLEFQNNGNVHYHIVTDTYIDYFFALKCWNRILSKLGYTQAYTAKFSAMRLNEYIANMSNYAASAFNVYAKRYAKGCAEKWKQPPTVDVRVCTSDNSIRNYISKYFNKNDANKTKCNRLDNEDNSFGLRLWFCSRSLSKCKSIVDFREIMPIDWFTLLDGTAKVFKHCATYCTSLYFNIREMSNEFKSLFYQAIVKYSSNLGYIPAYYSTNTS